MNRRSTSIKAAVICFCLQLCLLVQNVASFSVVQHAKMSMTTSTSSLRLPSIQQRRTNSHKVSHITVHQSTASAAQALDAATQPELSNIQVKLVKLGMMAFIASMCIALPVTLLPTELLYRAKAIDRKRKECLSLKTGQFCARWLMRLIPFCSIDVKTYDEKEPKPSVWVCNHTSMLDIFVLLAADKKLRGGKKRPVKIIYWKALEDNLITKLLFQQSGFIPVAMSANKAGDTNDYDKSSFKKLLKDTKQAFQDGFDIGILPEGQLNPTPEQGLLPCFSGAYTLARMAKRPIQMMALHGIHKLWHPDESIGMEPSSRKIKIRVYPSGRTYKDCQEFIETFETVVGPFGATGTDLPDAQLERWLDGTEWKERMENEKENEEHQ